MKRIIILFTLLLINNFSQAASFDCNSVKDTLKKTICSNNELSKLDERMSKYYFKIKGRLKKTESSNLLYEQRRWLELRNKKCRGKDAACLVALYKNRVFDLRKRYENIIPYKSINTASLQGIRSTCDLKGEKLPQKYKIYAGGAYSGRRLDAQIDQSGHQATQFDVVVNSPDNPVALILGAYEPSIWNIGWTKGTKIIAVVATGYHRQAVAGLPKDTPILNSSYDNRGPCGYLYITNTNLNKINPLSRRVFGRNTDLVYYARKGKIVFGKQLSVNTKLYTSGNVPPDIFFDKSKPLAGKAGLRDAVRRGLIRPVTSQDLARWAEKKAKIYKEEIPKVATGSRSNTFSRRYLYNGYVILKKFVIPAGLYGGNSATFFLPEGVPYPDGNLGHSKIYDFNTMTCRGLPCRR